MTVMQWIRFGWLRHKVISSGYCPYHGKEFAEGYTRERECETCIRNRVSRAAKAKRENEKRRHQVAQESFNEMIALANSEVPPAAPSCSENDAVEAARKEEK